jgi:hypothetical protein
MRSAEEIHHLLDRNMSPWWETHLFGVVDQSISAAPAFNVNGGLPALQMSALHELCLRRDDIVVAEAMSITPVASIGLVALPTG